MLKKSAVISKCGKYRYRLDRIWGDEDKYIAFIGLNPSTADAEKDDNTIRKCVKFSKRLGAGGLVMVNLFAFRSKNPKLLSSTIGIVGPENDEYIKEVTSKAALRIAIWGNHGLLHCRNIQVLEMLPRPVLCFGITKREQPIHPLYLKDSTRLQVYAS